MTRAARDAPLIAQPMADNQSGINFMWLLYQPKLQCSSGVFSWTKEEAMSSATSSGYPNQPAKSETIDLIASDKIEGTSVYNGAGEKLGSIYNLMVDKRSGKVAYAVMSFGGFLGMGSDYHPLPWETLTYDRSKGGYVVSLTREQLEGAPVYSDADAAMWDDPAYSRGIDEYYAPFGGMRQDPMLR
jgi:hypothetical protein